MISIFFSEARSNIACLEFIAQSPCVMYRNCLPAWQIARCLHVARSCPQFPKCCSHATRGGRWTFMGSSQQAGKACRTREVLPFQAMGETQLLLRVGFTRQQHVQVGRLSVGGWGSALLTCEWKYQGMAKIKVFQNTDFLIRTQKLKSTGISVVFLPVKYHNSGLRNK